MVTNGIWCHVEVGHAAPFLIQARAGTEAPPPVSRYATVAPTPLSRQVTGRWQGPGASDCKTALRAIGFQDAISHYIKETAASALWKFIGERRVMYCPLAEDIGVKSPT